MRALVTGADGFVGRWLVAHLRSSSDEVWTFGRRRRDEAEPTGHWEGDIRDPDAVARALDATRPDAIYHLAGVAFGPDVRADVAAAVDTTILGTRNVLDAAVGLQQRAIVLVTGSAEVYAPSQTPVNERASLGPTNAYGYTKLAQEATSLAYHFAGAVDVAVTRAFNHIGPGQRESFVVPAFALQLAQMAGGRSEPVLNVGNLDAIRDFTDVRDVVAAYRLIITERIVGTPVNVASGRGVRVGDVLGTLMSLANVTPEVRVDPARVRPGETPVIIGDAQRLRQTTGWGPAIPLERTLSDVWQDAQLRAAPA